MSGANLKHPYTGAQAEYLFTAFLSKFASVIPVPRQEDFGIDHLGFIVESTEHLRKVGYIFGTQLKPEKDQSLLFGVKKKNKPWKGHQIEWLFNQDQPFFLVTYEDVSRQVGSVEDKIDDRAYRIYSTAPMWHVRWLTNSRPYQVELKWSSEAPGKFIVPTSERVISPDETKHDGCKWTVQLGAPVVEMRLSELVAPETEWKTIARCLKSWIELDQRNIYHSRLGIPNFDVIATWGQNQEPSKYDSAWNLVSSFEEGKFTIDTLKAIVPGVRALAVNFVRQRRVDDFDAVVPLVKMLATYGMISAEDAEIMLKHLEEKVPSDIKEKKRIAKESSK